MSNVINWDSLTPAERNALVCGAFTIPGQKLCGLSRDGGKTFDVETIGDESGVKRIKAMKAEFDAGKSQYAGAEFIERTDYPPVTEYPALAIDLLEETQQKFGTIRAQCDKDGWLFEAGAAVGRNKEFAQAACIACLRLATTLEISTK